MRGLTAEAIAPVRATARRAEGTLALTPGEHVDVTAADAADEALLELAPGQTRPSRRVRIALTDAGSAAPGTRARVR